jgi:hypothetical protein
MRHTGVVGRTQSLDTSEAVEQRLLAGYRAMEPWEKARIVSELTNASFELAAAGLRSRRPALSDDEVRLILAARRLGPDLVRRATGRAVLPSDE